MEKTRAITVNTGLRQRLREGSSEGRGVALAVENDFIAALGSVGLCLFFGGGG
jgi:hypothetical protein